LTAPPRRGTICPPTKRQNTQGVNQLPLTRLLPHSTALAVCLAGILINIFLLTFYRGSGAAAPASTKKRWTDRWTFTPDELGGFSYGRLFLVSVLGLFLELLMIRWVSSEVRVFAYLKNFVLIGCFLGFGLGCYLCKRRIHLLALVIPLTAIAVLIKLPWMGLRVLIQGLPSYVGALSQVDVRGLPSLPHDLQSLMNLAAGLALIVPLFGLIAFSFIPVGQLVGWYLETAPRGIFAYTINILGSLAGIFVFALICFRDQPPPVWFLLAGVMLIPLIWRLPIIRWTAAAAILICMGLTSIGPGGQLTEYWSPYQKLTIRPVYDGARTRYLRAKYE